jgi:ligand-binding sensor protein
VKLEDILPIEKWAELEKEISATFGFNTSVFDENGIRITDFRKLDNQLCSVIQANEKGKNFICAVANRNVILQAKQIRKPVITECDAGLLKLVVPVFVDDEFLGVLSGCGLLADGSNVDIFLIKITTDIEEKEIIRLSNDIVKIEKEKN